MTSPVGGGGQREPVEVAPDSVPVDLDEARRRIDQAHEWVADLCSGERRWQMRIPVDPSDSDITISEALNFGEAMAAELAALRTKVEAVEKARADRAEAQVQRLRSDLRAANTTIEEAFTEAEAEVADLRAQLDAEKARADRDMLEDAVTMASLRAQLDAMGEAEIEQALIDAPGRKVPGLVARHFAASDFTLVTRTIRRSPWVPVDTEGGGRNG